MTLSIKQGLKQSFVPKLLLWRAFATPLFGKSGAESLVGNRTRLKIVGLERMHEIEQHVEVSPNRVLPNVSSLDISYNSFSGGIPLHRRRKSWLLLSCFRAW